MLQPLTTKEHNNLNKVKSLKRQKSNNPAEELNNAIIYAIQQLKGKDIVLLDLRELTDTPADFFIICEGDSVVQIKAIVNKIKTYVKEELGDLPSRIEGKDGANWILADYFTTIVHVFHPDQRDFYQLEDLWSDAKRTEIEAL